MIITAMLKRNSRIWTMWRSQIRLSGQIHGVLFRWKPDNNYSTCPLVKEEIALLRKHPDVQLEISGVELQFAPEPTPAKADKVDAAVSEVCTTVSDSPKQLKERIANAVKGTEFQVASPAVMAAIEAALGGKAPAASSKPGIVDKLPPVPAYVRKAQNAAKK